MSKLDSVFSKACSEITQNILTINEPTKKQVKEEIKRFQEITKYYQWQKKKIFQN